MPDATLELHIADLCCSPHFVKASHAGELSSDEWSCPECGTLWRGKMIPESSMRVWEPFEIIDVIPWGLSN
jgi:hypothetical protein